MLIDEQIKNIKHQILKQIDSWKASDEQKKQAKQQIEAMSSEQLEEFLQKNKLIKNQEKEPESKISGKEQQECPFCLIAENKIPSYKLNENKESVAVLEISPLSLGHTIIIPRKHIQTEKISSQAFSLAKKLAKKVKIKLKPKDIKIETSNVLGHGIINVIPIYNEKLERKKADEKELILLQEKLMSKKKTTIIGEKKSKQPKQLEKAPRRIP